MTSPAQPPPPRHLYVHVPFCQRRCTYCDFSIAVRRTVPVGEYAAALGHEVALTGARPVETVYLGGGTPSRLGGDGIAALARLLGLERTLAEFTLEANPEDVSAGSVRAWISAGVNRLSLGAQSFDDRVLAWMHRTHDAARIGEAVRTARAGGMRNLSLDLIFALPTGLGRDWRRDLDAAIALEPEHVSLYGLTVEPGTPLFRQAERGEVAVASEERYEAEYLLAHERLAAAGYVFYEVSNAARSGWEAVHNRAYWHLEPYLGLGPAAHSFDGVSRWWNEATYVGWRRKLEQGRSPVAGHEILNDHQRRLEQMYLGLRTRHGMVLPDPCPPPLRQTLDRWVAAGWAVLEPEAAAASGASMPPAHGARSPAPIGEGPHPRLRARLTPAGWLRLDELVASI
jgi:oxygen-independent coproporphyrinogen-3 oxidase